MDNARKNLVEQISNLIQKYTDEYLKIKETEENKEKASKPFPNIFNLPDVDNSEDYYFQSFDEIRDFFTQRKKRNNKIIKLLREIRSGKYDDVFSYYNFQKSLSSSKNSSKNDLNMESYISDDYPLMKRREQRKDVEMIPDPQLVLNFPTISSLSNSKHSNFSDTELTTLDQQEHSTEMPIRKLIGQKKRQVPSMKNIINFQSNINDVDDDEKEIQIKNRKFSPNEIDSIIPPSKDTTINFTQDQSIITQEKIQGKNTASPHRYSQPSATFKFLDLYPPDPPLILPSNLNKINEDRAEDPNINSKASITENNKQQKEIKNPFSSKRNQESKTASPFRTYKKTVESKSPNAPHFLSSNSSSNSSIPTDNSESKSPNPFTSPLLEKNRSPFSTTSFKPIISSPVRNSFHYLTSTSSTTSENTRRNSSSSTHSSLLVLSPVPSSKSSPTRISQPNSLLKKSENVNEEEESDEQDSIIEYSSNDISLSPQKKDDQNELNGMSPIITGKDIISNDEKHFLSEDDNEIGPDSSNQLDIYEKLNQQAETYDNQNVIAQDEKLIKESKMQKPKNDLSDSNSKNKIENDSSSEFDESNLSQSLQQSSFIFQDNNSGSQRGMVRSSENPYTKLDAITRLPIRK